MGPAEINSSAASSRAALSSSFSPFNSATVRSKAASRSACSSFTRTRCFCNAVTPSMIYSVVSPGVLCPAFCALRFVWFRLRKAVAAAGPSRKRRTRCTSIEGVVQTSSKRDACHSAAGEAAKPCAALLVSYRLVSGSSTVIYGVLLVFFLGFGPSAPRITAACPRTDRDGPRGRQKSATYTQCIPITPR